MLVDNSREPRLERVMNIDAQKRAAPGEEAGNWASYQASETELGRAAELGIRGFLPGLGAGHRAPTQKRLRGLLCCGCNHLVWVCAGIGPRASPCL